MRFLVSGVRLLRTLDTHRKRENEHGRRCREHPLVQPRATVMPFPIQQNPYRYTVQHSKCTEEKRLEEQGNELQAKGW